MSEERKKISPLKKIIFSLIPLLMLFLFIEITFNIVYFQRKENEIFATVFAYKKWVNKDKSKNKEKTIVKANDFLKKFFTEEGINSRDINDKRSIEIIHIKQKIS